MPSRKRLLPGTGASFGVHLARPPSFLRPPFNPLFTPDVADLYVFQLRATNATGAICIRTVELTATALALTNPALREGTFSVSVLTAPGWTYALEFKDSADQSQWTPLPAVAGHGTIKELTDPTATAPQRFYRVRSEPLGLK
jgi:hypothetical protein